MHGPRPFGPSCPGCASEGRRTRVRDPVARLLFALRVAALAPRGHVPDRDHGPVLALGEELRPATAPGFAGVAPFSSAPPNPARMAVLGGGQQEAHVAPVHQAMGDLGGGGDVFPDKRLQP